MIKSVAVKKLLKGSIFKVVTAINMIVHKKDNIILLHMGNKAIGFNLRPLLEYLLENGYNNRYRIICSVESKEYFEEGFSNIKFVTHVYAIIWYLKAKHVFYTAGQLPIKPSSNQIVIHMNHGITDYKTVGALTKINNGDEFFFTYIIASSKLYVPITMSEYLCAKENVIVCSEPMVDRILHPVEEIHFGGYDKVLLWMPTFRQSDYLGYDDSTQEELLPLFKEDDYTWLNRILEKYNILLVVKLHPNQNTNAYKKTMFSNLRIYSHTDFQNTGKNIYDLMAHVDGLLGDYSSASMQFLLTDKPIAFVIPDYEEYKEKRGFVFDNPLDYMPGHIIMCKEEFGKFIKDFANNVDVYASERKKVKNIIHQYQDGKSCERLLKISKIG